MPTTTSISRSASSSAGRSVRRSRFRNRLFGLGSLAIVSFATSVIVTNSVDGAGAGDVRWNRIGVEDPCKIYTVTCCHAKPADCLLCCEDIDGPIDLSRCIQCCGDCGAAESYGSAGPDDPSTGSG